jgi:hypothetical protein
VLARSISDLESLEAMSQDAPTRALFLRMATMARAGRLASFVDGLSADDELDEQTKSTITELAGDESFLLVFEDYLRRTHVGH